MIIPQDVINDLNKDFTVEVISSTQLVTDIQRKQQRRSQQLAAKGLQAPPTKTSVTPIKMFNPLKNISIKPFSLLHSIGRITTPPVPNLADLSATWAIYRYVWAFDISKPIGWPMLLADTAREIDFHQKTLLSDEVGVGMANYIMNSYFHTTDSIDVSLALKSPDWHITPQGKTSPDYLFYNDPAKDIYVVECKGNQSSYAETIHQLQRGTEQVPSITFTDGRKSTSIIIGTCMLSQSTNVYIVDPEPEQPKEENNNEIDYGKSEKIGPSQWRVKNDDLFASDSRLFSRAKLLMYAGAEYEALAQLPPEFRDYWQKYARKSAQSEELGTDLGIFEGVSDSFRTFDGHNITLYKGLLSQLRNQLTLPFQKPNQRLASSREQITPPLSYSRQFQEAGFKVNITQIQSGYTIQSFCSDGSIMQLSII